MFCGKCESEFCWSCLSDYENCHCHSELAENAETDAEGGGVQENESEEEDDNGETQEEV